MNGRSQMQGVKNWILSKEINASGSSETLIGGKSRKNHFCPSIGPNGGTVTMDLGRCPSLHTVKKIKGSNTKNL
jgi:hypothetical protein